MSVVDNIQAMSSAVDALTQKVNALHASVSQVGTAAQSAFGSVMNGVSAPGGQLQLGQGSASVMPTSMGHVTTQVSSPTGMSGASTGAINGGVSGGGTNAGGTGGGYVSAGNKGVDTSASGSGGNIIDRALARVTAPDPSGMGNNTTGIGQMVMGIGQMALAPVAGAYAGAMSTAAIVDSATSYYQSTLRSGGMSRSAVENATFSAMRGGMTSVGSPAIVSNILANSGYMPGTTDYNNAARQTALAAQNYGMENSAAANAITGLSNFNTANTLFSMGISTIDNNGNQMSPGDITKQVLQRLYPQGYDSKTLNQSLKTGSLQNQLALMGLGDANSPTQNLILGNAFTLANGGNPNAVQNNSNNANPQQSIFNMNQSQTGILQGSEANALSGLQLAAQYVKGFNDTMGPLLQDMAKYKAAFEGAMSTNAGQGTMAFAKNFLGGLKNLFSGGMSALQSAAGAAAAGGGTPGYGGSFGGRGGGSSGLMSSFGSMSSTANPTISATYGETDPSGIWSSTGNQHQGVDYAVPTGTPVRATLDGIVSGKVLSADYGQAVLLEHPGGYSSIYAHLSNKEVSIGAQVKAGDEIGKSGSSGNVTGPSLHYEVWKGENNPVDPATLPGAFNSPINIGSLADIPNTPGKPGARAVNPNAGTAGDQEFAKALLSKAGINATDANITALTTWMHWEGGTKNNAFNPLNTTLDMQGATNFNSVGVKSYSSLQQGVDATYETLTGANATQRGYTQILADLKGNAPLNQVVSDINHSSWGTKIRGGGTPGAGGGPVSSSGGGGTINNVVINVGVANASDTEAQLFAKKVKAYLENDSGVATLGSS